MYTTQGFSVKLNEVFRKNATTQGDPGTKKWWILSGLLGLELLFPTQKLNHVQGKNSGGSPQKIADTPSRYRRIFAQQSRKNTADGVSPPKFDWICPRNGVLV